MRTTSPVGNGKGLERIILSFMSPGTTPMRSAPGFPGRTYPNGDTISKQDANYEGSGAEAIGRYPPNGYGLYDMAGNVWEWCNDWYDDDYYEKSPNRNPAGPSAGSLRTRRGGSWNYGTEILRCANRGSGGPSVHKEDFGFRLVIKN